MWTNFDDISRKTLFKWYHDNIIRRIVNAAKLFTSRVSIAYDTRSSIGTSVISIHMANYEWGSGKRRPNCSYQCLIRASYQSMIIAIFIKTKYHAIWPMLSYLMNYEDKCVLWHYIYRKAQHFRCFIIRNLTELRAQILYYHLQW